MFAFSMNSKRERRPNVRLGEIGDASAAFACGISRKDKENLVQKRWKHDFLNPKELGYNPISGFSQQKSFEFTDPDVSLRTSADVEHNRERTKPNALKSVYEFPSSDEIDVRSEVNFGRITKKYRLRRKRSTRSTSCVFGGTWNSKIGPEINSEDGKMYASTVGFTSNACFGVRHINDFKDSSDNETSATGKANCGNDIYELTFSGQRQGTTSIQLTEEGACSEDNNAFTQSFGECEKITMPFPSQPDVNSVRRWLEELGFGKYAGVFEMHEVDEEALPLLTLEDLKEMGVLAVGPRRRLYTAIQQLKGGKEGVYA